MDEKEKTAYHEGGHCLRAWRANFLATLTTCLKLDDGGHWSGSTPIRRNRFSTSQLAEIALAGLLSEAKAAASDGGPLANVTSTDNLATQISQLFVDQHIPVAELGFELEQDDAWEIPVPLAGGGAQAANVTRADLVEVPLLQRGQPQIKAALDALVEFVNDDVHWAAIDGIAKALLHLGGGCLTHFAIYAIVMNETAGLLEAHE